MGQREAHAHFSMSDPSVLKSWSTVVYRTDKEPEVQYLGFLTFFVQPFVSVALRLRWSIRSERYERTKKCENWASCGADFWWTYRTEKYSFTILSEPFYCANWVLNIENGTMSYWVECFCIKVTLLTLLFRPIVIRLWNQPFNTLKFPLKKWVGPWVNFKCQ